MYQEVGEKVKVLASFEAGKITPKAFFWKARRFLVEKVNLDFQEREGKSINYFFAAETDRGNTVKLKYSSEKMIWTLEEIWVE